MFRENAKFKATHILQLQETGAQRGRGGEKRTMIATGQERRYESVNEKLMII